jgi:hypothetical protein
MLLTPRSLKIIHSMASNTDTTAEESKDICADFTTSELFDDADEEFRIGNTNSFIKKFERCASMEKIANQNDEQLENPIGHRMARALLKCINPSTFDNLVLKFSLACKQNTSFLYTKNKKGVRAVLHFASIPSLIVTSVVMSYCKPTTCTIVHADHLKENLIDPEGFNVFHYAARNSYIGSMYQCFDFELFLRMWISKNLYDVNQHSSVTKETALHCCVDSNNAPLARHLLELGAEPDRLDSEQETPLLRAFTRGRGETVVRELVLGNCNTETIITRHGRTLDFLINDLAENQGVIAARRRIMKIVRDNKMLATRRAAQLAFITYQKSLDLDMKTPSTASEGSSSSSGEPAQSEPKCKDNLMFHIEWKRTRAYCDSPQMGEGEPTDCYERADYRMVLAALIRSGDRPDIPKGLLPAFEEFEEEDKWNYAEDMAIQLLSSVKLKSVANDPADKPENTWGESRWYDNDHATLQLIMWMAHNGGHHPPPDCKITIMPNPELMHDPKYPYAGFGGCVIEYDWDRLSQYKRIYAQSSLNPYAGLEVLYEHNNSVALNLERFHRVVMIDEKDPWTVNINDKHIIFNTPIEFVPRHELLATALREEAQYVIENAEKEDNKAVLEAAKRTYDSRPLAPIQSIKEVTFVPTVFLAIDLTNNTVRGAMVDDEEEYMKELSSAYTVHPNATE